MKPTNTTNNKTKSLKRGLAIVSFEEPDEERMPLADKYDLLARQMRAMEILDAETSFEVLDAILKLDGYTRVIVTHDLDENILRRCTGLFALKNGVVTEQGSFDELMEQKG